jgi:hypothetical protein
LVPACFALAGQRCQRQGPWPCCFPGVHSPLHLTGNMHVARPGPASFLPQPCQSCKQATG